MVRLLAGRIVLSSALLALALSHGSAAAEPIKLRLAFLTSDQSVSYITAIKPFVDAVNGEPGDIVRIEPIGGRALGQELGRYADLVLDASVDIAFVVPYLAPGRFTNMSVMDLPGLFRDQRETTLVYARLIATHILTGYDDFLVIGAFATEPSTIDSRPSIAKLADLKGMTIAINNPMQAAALEKLGMRTAVMPYYAVTEAISAGRIDAVAAQMFAEIDFGISRFTTHHYLLGLTPTWGALLMNKAKFASLPPEAKDIIRKYSGDWAAVRHIQIYGDYLEKQANVLRSDPRRKVTVPSAADTATAHAMFQTVIDDWLGQDPRNAALLQATESEIAKLRPSSLGP